MRDQPAALPALLEEVSELTCIAQGQGPKEVHRLISYEGFKSLRLGILAVLACEACALSLLSLNRSQSEDGPSPSEAVGRSYIVSSGASVRRPRSGVRAWGEHGACPLHILAPEWWSC